MRFALPSAARPLHLEPDCIRNGTRYIRRRLSHRPLECRLPAKGHSSACGEPARPGRRYPYVDMRLAYDELPKQTKRRLDELKQFMFTRAATARGS